MTSEPHIPLLAGEAKEESPAWKRHIFDLKQKRPRHRKVKQAKARNRVRDIQQTQGLFNQSQAPDPKRATSLRRGQESARTRASSGDEAFARV